jgi:crotonobetainyl-CoA:carnitine CoA-transferase CaiB-like acyl-CoA transferase
MGGLMSLCGIPEGMPGGEPMRAGVAVSDLITGMYATSAILAAIEHRHISGKGQYIDLALLDCTVALTSYMAMNYFLSGVVPKRLGNAHSNMVPYQVFKCADGNMIVAVGNDSQFVSLCKVIGVPELGTDPRFHSPGQRVINREILVPMIAEILLTRPMAQWVDLMDAANIPCGPINNMQQVFENEQVIHRNLKRSIPHGAGVQAPAVASPMNFSDTPIQHTRSAPMLGEHNAEVLETLLGMDAQTIDTLRQKGII